MFTVYVSITNLSNSTHELCRFISFLLYVFKAPLDCTYFLKLPSSVVYTAFHDEANLIKLKQKQSKKQKQKEQYFIRSGTLVHLNHGIINHFE